ncbi:MAG: hypothetical protein OYK82_04725 [Gammaproteobacteria bacterium]|nr:hypothetical protein [Gammaproteobacteria bacterium]
MAFSVGGGGASASQVRQIIREELGPVQKRLEGIEETLKWLRENVFTKPNPPPKVP